MDTRHIQRLVKLLILPVLLFVIGLALYWAFDDPLKPERAPGVLSMLGAGFLLIFELTFEELKSIKRRQQPLAKILNTSGGRGFIFLGLSIAVWSLLPLFDGLDSFIVPGLSFAFGVYGIVLLVIARIRP